MSIDLDAIEARIAAATPGPWDTDGTTVWACVIVPDPRDQSGQTPMQDRELVAQSGDPDADLIAHAPTDLAALAAEVKRLSRRLGMTRDNAADDLAELRAENERLRAVADAARVLIPSGDSDSLTEYAIAWADLHAALDAWRAGGGA